MERISNLGKLRRQLTTRYVYSLQQKTLQSLDITRNIDQQLCKQMLRPERIGCYGLRELGITAREGWVG
jgi:hypothetical protein